MIAVNTLSHLMFKAIPSDTTTVAINALAPPQSYITSIIIRRDSKSKTPWGPTLLPF